MEFFDYDEDLLVEIPCEFCNDPFPIQFLMEHQTGCRPDLARVIEPSVEEIEAEFLNLPSPSNSEKKTEDSSKKLINLADPPSEPRKDILVKEKTSNELDKNFAFVDPFSEPKKDIVKEKASNESDKNFQDGETFSFHSTSHREKRIEEEKPSFKFPPNSLIHSGSHVFQNILTESDSEDNESLEDFWKRAAIKLDQRLKFPEKMKSNTKLYRN